MVQVCERTKSKNDMLEETIVQYKEMYLTTRREFEKVIAVCLLSNLYAFRLHNDLV